MLGDTSRLTCLPNETRPPRCVSDFGESPTQWGGAIYMETHQMPRKRIQMPTGTRFGRLTVLEEAERRTRRQFRCKCDCGGVSVVALEHLRSGHTTSCGCVRQGNNRTHGLSHLPEHSVWCGMVKRCVNPNAKGYKLYGGRGLTVCERWKESFNAFYTDMGPRPSPKHSIDRVDNDGNYEPSNCRWATRSQQQRNMRNNQLLTHQGQTKCVSEWAEEVGIRQQTLRSRVCNGWSIGRALTEPVRKRRKSTA